MNFGKPEPSDDLPSLVEMFHRFTRKTNDYVRCQSQSVELRQDDFTTPDKLFACQPPLHQTEYLRAAALHRQMQMRTYPVRKTHHEVDQTAMYFARFETRQPQSKLFR
jgi:hypothetical protein